MSIVNGYEIAYTVTSADGRVIIKTLSKDNAATALANHPGAILATKALDSPAVAAYEGYVARAVTALKAAKATA